MGVYYCFYNRIENKIKEQKEKAGHKAGYALLSYALEKEYKIYKLPKIEKGRYGKPFFPDYPQIQFNISHCDSMAVCVLARQEVGIDVEEKRKVSQALVKKALTEQERDTLQQKPVEYFEMGFLQYWTLKESFIKAIGRGLSFPLKDVEFYFHPNQRFPNLLSLSTLQKQSLSNLFTSLSPISSNQKDWQFFQIVLEENYLLSVCFRKEEIFDKRKDDLQEVVLVEREQRI